jgi:hypothetical protein
VIFDKAGNLYGTTTPLRWQLGTVYEIAANGIETVLHRFNKDGTDGSTRTSSPQCSSSLKYLRASTTYDSDTAAMKIHRTHGSK